jgi:hypothetical protein
MCGQRESEQCAEQSSAGPGPVFACSCSRLGLGLDNPVAVVTLHSASLLIPCLVGVFALEPPTLIRFRPLSFVNHFNLDLNLNQLPSFPSQPHPTMCGIFFALSSNAHIEPDNSTRRLLENRGPDATGLHHITVGPQGQKYHATFLSTVLSLRGTAVVDQPLKHDASGSVLCWNGEAWSIQGQPVTTNDSQSVFALLLDACAGSAAQSTAAVVHLLSSIRGPYALVFYDAVHSRIYFGRDCLGRRSLLRKSTQDNSLVLSSVCDNASGDTWAEVEADGIYVADLDTIDSTSGPHITHIPHVRLGQIDAPDLCFVGESPPPRCQLIPIDSTLPIHELSSTRPTSYL